MSWAGLASPAVSTAHLRRLWRPGLTVQPRKKVLLSRNGWRSQATRTQKNIGVFFGVETGTGPLQTRRSLTRLRAARSAKSRQQWALRAFWVSQNGLDSFFCHYLYSGVRFERLSTFPVSPASSVPSTSRVTIIFSTRDPRSRFEMGLSFQGGVCRGVLSRVRSRH
jgi:hypothetical protein